MEKRFPGVLASMEHLESAQRIQNGHLLKSISKAKLLLESQRFHVAPDILDLSQVNRDKKAN